MGGRPRCGGAVEALARARDEGLTRFIGVTGHGLRIARMHRLSLEQFPFDSVLLPVNFTLLGEPGYRADVEELIAICERDRVAVQAIKAIARRRWSDDAADPRFSWYEPLADEAAIGRAVRYVLSDPRLFLSRRATTASSRRPSRPPRVRSTARRTTSSPPTSRRSGSRRSSTARRSNASDRAVPNGRRPPR